MEILRVENLTKVYGSGNNKVVALDNVSFSVEKGEFVSIVGASGSGKSTLLHLLGGVDRPTSGKVLINDTDIFKMNDDELAIFRRRQVGLIYQFYNLIPILNVRENITLPLELDNKRVSDEEVDNLIKMLGLDKRSKHLPNELSGGEQQRTSIGRALISRPAIVLADEPTGNLDTKASEEIVSLLKKSNKEMKQTIIMITHNLEFSYLGEEKAYEVVVTNTNKISDMCEQISPISPEKCPPHIPGCEEDIKNIAYKNLQLNKKRNIVTVIGIILSVALITALSSLVVSFKESIINLEKHINGDFHYSFDGVQSNDLGIFENNRSIENFYKVGTLGYAKINTENEYKPYAYVITMDKNDFNSVGIELTDGELPKNNNEIIIPRHLRNNGKVDLKVGDTITLEVGSRMSEGYALGQNNPYEETNNETIENTVSVTYKVVGIFERPSTALEPFSSPGYTFITTNASGVKNYTVFARYTREGLKNEYKVTAGILGVNEKVLKKNIQEFNYKEVNEKEQGKSKFYFDINRYLIMLETNAYGDSSMKALLVLSTIVTVIIIGTSVY